jgi:hypothetical protein
MNKFKIRTIFKFEQKSKYEQFSNLNKNTKSEKKPKKEKEKEKKKRKEKKDKKSTKRKFADQHGPGPNTPGCREDMRRGAKRAANRRQIGIPGRCYTPLFAGRNRSRLGAVSLWAELIRPNRYAFFV